jgi:hypothetical protein
MPAGIRATIEFTDPEVCPIAGLSRTAGTTVEAVTTNVCVADCGPTVTEFSVTDDLDPDRDYGVDGTITPVFSHGSTRRYRLVHDGERGCPCACLSRFGCPVERYAARDGTLTLVFHAADYEELKAVVAGLRERFPGTNIRRFVRAPAGDGRRDTVLVDRSRLTARQLEVLKTAHEMGYFGRPREANATEVAAELGINPATFSEHLATAQAKLLEDVL